MTPETFSVGDTVTYTEDSNDVLGTGIIVRIVGEYAHVKWAKRWEQRYAPGTTDFTVLPLNTLRKVAAL